MNIWEEENIKNDYMKISSTKQHEYSNIKKSIAITCLDQINNGEAIYYKDNKILIKPTIEFVEDVCMKINPYSCYLSYGPTRSTILVH